MTSILDHQPPQIGSQLSKRSGHVSSGAPIPLAFPVSVDLSATATVRRGPQVKRSRPRALSRRRRPSAPARHRCAPRGPQAAATVTSDERLFMPVRRSHVLLVGSPMLFRETIELQIPTVSMFFFRPKDDGELVNSTTLGLGGSLCLCFRGNPNQWSLGQRARESSSMGHLTTSKTCKSVRCKALIVPFTTV